jgi:hypothetical protein
MLEVSEVRRRLRQAIDRARRDAAARRVEQDRAAADYERFLESTAGPVFRLFLSALRGEGYLFKIFTPAGTLRLASEKSAEDFIEVALDDQSHPPVVLGRTSLARGRRVTTSERPIREGAPISQLTQEDVLAFLVAEIAPFVER